MEEQWVAKVVRCQLYHMKRQSLTSQKSISCTDPMRVICPDTVHRLLSLNSELLHALSLKQMQDLIEKIRTKAPRLLAMCIVARLGITCFKELLDKVWSDATLPLTVDHLCHAPCEETFDLLLHIQGSYIAPIFKLGEDMDLEHGMVLPIQYWPRNPGTQLRIRMIRTVATAPLTRHVPTRTARGTKPLVDVERLALCIV